ncbi:MAG: hypothetical protein WA777_00460 [Rhodanobacter sp.]
MSDGTIFCAAVGEIEKIKEQLELTALHAFSELENQYFPLATVLIEWAGDRRNAVRWMMVPRAIFCGRSAYQMTADGDADAILDRIIRVEWRGSGDEEQHPSTENPAKISGAPPRKFDAI